MRIFDTGTLTPDDVMARIGKLTASRMSDACDFLVRGGEGARRKQYKRELIAERLTGIATSHYVTREMQWGIDHEGDAKRLYEDLTQRQIRPGKFYDHPSIDWCGATPDGFVILEGLVEIKCPSTSTYIDWLLEDEVPEQHKPQMLLQIAVTQKLFVDFVAYDPRMPEHLRMRIWRFQPPKSEIKRIEEMAIEFIGEVKKSIDRVMSTGIQIPT